MKFYSQAFLLEKTTHEFFMNASLEARVFIHLRMKYLTSTLAIGPGYLEFSFVWNWKSAFRRHLS